MYATNGGRCNPFGLSGIPAGCKAVMNFLNMRTIVLFDPYPITRLGFSQVLKSGNGVYNGLVVSSVDELERLKSTLDIDLLILTINTPRNRDVFSAVRECKDVCPGVPLVLYDEGHHFSNLDAWLKSGVSGYLFKNEPVSILLQCVDVVVNGGKYLSPEGWSRHLDPSAHPMPLKNGKLGKREYEVARYLSDGKSTTWIAGNLGRKPSTISTIKKRVFNKLNVDNVVDLRSILITVSASVAKTADKLNLPPQHNAPTIALT